MSPSDTASPFQRAPGASAPEPSARPPITLSIEPLEDEAATGVNPGASSRTPPGSARKPRTVTSHVDDQSDLKPAPKDPKPSSAAPRPAPWRMPGVFGRLLGPLPGGPPRGGPRSSDAKTDRKVDSPPAPATDASVKRKIEREIRETLGDRVRAVEVRVSGRNVLVVARATRFWQKRSVRQSLETLPALAGLRARIELDN